jgi:ubiquinone/menaquinone biosynthesis C-methylase UbiE
MSIIADIGAGTGNYSNAVADYGYNVFAVEPSYQMVLQSNPHPSVKWLKGKAEQLSIRNRAVDGVVCVLASHHFKSLEKAASEFRRICESGPIILFTFDPRQSETFWLKDYFPRIWEKAFVAFDEIEKTAEILAGDIMEYEIIPFPLPDNLGDRFAASGWKYPEIYLDKNTRNSMSAFALEDSGNVEIGIKKLKKDMDSGYWKKMYGYLTEEDEFDLGYRFIKIRKR